MKKLNANWIITALAMLTCFISTRAVSAQNCVEVVCPTNQVVFLPCGANCAQVFYQAFTTNYCSPTNLSVQYYPPSGTCFGVGTNQVTVIATGSGQSNYCSFFVTVLPNPNCQTQTNCIELICPTNLVVYLPCGSNCAPVFYPVFATNYCNPGNISVQYYPPSGTCFGLGTNQVTVVATGSGQSNYCSFFVTVLPNPNCQTQTNCIELICPTNPVVYLPCGSNCAPVFYSVFATNYCSPGNLSVQYYPPSGTCFGVGTNQVTVIATGSGQSNYCSFFVTVLPNPNCQTQTNCIEIICPTNPVVYLPCGSNCAPVFYKAFATNYCSPADLIVQYYPPSGTCFGAGTNQVTVVATGSGQSNYCSFFVTVLPNPNCQNQTNCIELICPTNPVVYLPCGSNCAPVFYKAYATNYCVATDLNVQYYPPSGTCFGQGTNQVTVIATGSGQSNYCSFFVTVLPNPNCQTQTNCIELICPTNPVVYLPCGSNCAPVFYKAFATNYCSPADLIVQYHPPSGTCFGLGTNQVTVVATGSGQSNYCTFFVTVLPNPNCQTNTTTQCMDPYDGVKYVQEPNFSGGFDVRDTQDVLADDFVCTNIGPISDIHLWGSWLNDQALTNTINFWLGIYSDVPGNAANPYSHPGTNLLWQQWFAPGQYAENLIGNDADLFLDPVTQALSNETNAWYYCFYPTNALVQQGTVASPKIYWLAAYAQLPAGIPFQFGWKTTTGVQNDISVHALWPGMPPVANPGWTPTMGPGVTGGPMPLDLAFKLTTQTNCCPVSISYVNPAMVMIRWDCGVLQSATSLTGPYTDVTGAVSPYATPVGTIPYKFYRTVCR